MLKSHGTGIPWSSGQEIFQATIATTTLCVHYTQSNSVYSKFQKRTFQLGAGVREIRIICPFTKG